MTRRERMEAATSASRWQRWNNPVPMSCDSISRVNDAWYGCSNDAMYVLVSECGEALRFECHPCHGYLPQAYLPSYLPQAGGQS